MTGRPVEQTCGTLLTPDLTLGSGADLRCAADPLTSPVCSALSPKP